MPGIEGCDTPDTCDCACEKCARAKRARLTYEGHCKEHYVNCHVDCLPKRPQPTFGLVELPKAA